MTTNSRLASALHVPAVQLAVLGRQLLLVPEAPLLLALLCIHFALGSPPALALLGLAVAAGFGARMGLLKVARQALDGGDYEQAERLTSAALSIYPYSADAQALLGTIRLASGDAAGATVALRRAISYYPAQSGLHAALAAALLDSGELRAALATARLALALDPGCAQAYLHLAAADAALGAEPEVVEAHLRSGLSRSAQPADEAALRCALAGQLIALGREAEARLAIAGAEALLSSCPATQRAGLHYHIGDLLRLSGDDEGARGHFSASAALDPGGRFATQP
jgi:hypothetical protein